MKVSIIQPKYSMDSNDLEKCFYDMLEQINQCDDSMDIIVLPEYCDVPANTDNCRQFHECIEKYNEIIKNTVIETAKRCKSIVFANVIFFSADFALRKSMSRRKIRLRLA